MQNINLSLTIFIIVKYIKSKVEYTVQEELISQETKVTADDQIGKKPSITSKKNEKHSS